MRFALQVTGLAVGIPLEILIIAVMLRGGYRRFPFIFLYSVVDLLATIVELPSAVDYVRGRASSTTLASLYWMDETLLQLLIYLAVMSLIYEATAKLQSRRILRTCLILGAPVIAGTSFLLHYHPALNFGSLMTPWLRDLNFCSAVLDLALWTLLLGSRNRDRQILLLSGALGIQFSGVAIGESIQQLAIQSRSRPISLTGSLIVMLANLLRLYLWWRALKAVPETTPAKIQREPSARTTTP